MQTVSDSNGFDSSAQQAWPQVELTEKAAEVFKEACQAEEKTLEESYMRVMALPGGCSGYKYGLEWNSSDQVDQDDVVQRSQEVQIVVKKQQLTDILGPLQIDYSTASMVEQGFVFKQLTGGRQCGCGESFTAVKDLNKSTLSA